MCGIIGAYGSQEDLKLETLKKATAVLHHRGPDCRQHWISEDAKVGLGHARLSIIDLTGGTQPLQNEDGCIHAVVNGEFYNFEKIRTGLKAKGHRFATESDSEILIHLYEDLGMDALHELRGEFAFILYDARTNRLIACRDRFGIKPLFYTYYNGSFYLASEVKALLAMGVPARWDVESFYIACHFGAIPMQDRTFFKGVYQIPPGHFLLADEHQYRILKYWDFNYPLLENYQYHLNEESSIEAFRNYFEEAVRLRLRADVPVGVYLSGGIDSCSILGTVAKLTDANIRAFSIRFEDAAYDETDAAEEMADYAGAEFHSFLVNQELVARYFVETIRFSEVLSVNPHSVAKFILSEHVRDSGYKVVLTGEGSDEILGGYPHFRQDLLLYAGEDGANGESSENLKILAENNDVSQGILLAAHRVNSNNALKRRLGFVPSWLEPLMAGGFKIKALFTDELLASFAGFDPYSVFLDNLDIQNQVRGRHVLNQSLYLWSKLSLPSYLLTNLGDRMEMSHSIEGRVPFLDHKLVEFVTTIPVSLKINNTTEKYILREAARPVISEKVYERHKHPFIAPPSGKTKEDPLFAFIQEYIGDHLSEMPFFERQKIAGLLHAFPEFPAKERKRIDPIIMILASMVALQEQFGLSVT